MLGVRSQAAARHEVEHSLEELHDLVECHRALENEPESAAEMRRRFCVVITDAEAVLGEETLGHFVAGHITPDDFAGVEWERVSQVVTLLELFCGLQDRGHLSPAQVDTYVRELVRHAGRAFERRGEDAELFALFQQIAFPPSMLDEELTRLRKRARLYEMRRVEKRRWLLKAALILQILFCFVIAPLLFVHFENRARAEVPPQAITGSTENNEPTLALAYSDALYWAIQTGTSIGYGDITPLAPQSRVLASALRLTGILAVALIAGLVLNPFGPRALLDYK
ncbi:MAG: potassium channel family protein [Chloroflexota bacterium]|nr:potassium channel family protein [Chloroflexota bacterium]